MFIKSVENLDDEDELEEVQEDYEKIIQSKNPPKINHLLVVVVKKSDLLPTLCRRYQNRCCMCVPRYNT